MKQRYGIPYMGSKEKILHLIRYIFQREHNKEYFIDPFCGGFAVGAYALHTTNFKVLANDLNKYVIALHKEILFNNSEEIKKVWMDWVSREKFFDVKESPDKYPDWYVGYVLTIWSFGNSQKSYLFGKDIEEIKRQAHEYLMENGYDGKESRIKLLKEFKRVEKIKGRFELQQLQQLERLQQLEQLESMDWFDFINSIPKKVLENAFIYCDPPYENITGYQKNNVDYDQFWDWFRNSPYPVYASSYSAPEDIDIINQAKKMVLFSTQERRKKSNENIYFNGAGKHSQTMYDMLFNKKDN